VCASQWRAVGIAEARATGKVRLAPCAKSDGADTGIQPAPALPPQHCFDSTSHRRASQLCAHRETEADRQNVTRVQRRLRKRSSKRSGAMVRE
jgi:hypothetical protein